MDVVTGVELECSYGAGDGRTRSRVVSMPKERSGGPRLDWSCDWEKYGYDTIVEHDRGGEDEDEEPEGNEALRLDACMNVMSR